MLCLFDRKCKFSDGYFALSNNNESTFWLNDTNKIITIELDVRK